MSLWMRSSVRKPNNEELGSLRSRSRNPKSGGMLARIAGTNQRLLIPPAPPTTDGAYAIRDTVVPGVQARGTQATTGARAVLNSTCCPENAHPAASTPCVVATAFR